MKHYTLTIRGKTKEWGFDIMADPKFVDEWRADGLQVDEIIYSVPQWGQWLGLTDLFCWLQDRGRAK